MLWFSTVEGEAEGAWAGLIDWDSEPLPGGGLPTEGHLRTRYSVQAGGDHRRALRTVVDALVQDAEKLGIEMADPCLRPEPSGERPFHPLPEGWREMLRQEADRLGWGVFDHDLEED